MAQGLELGCLEMCIGERRRIHVPPRLGFGTAGSRVYSVPGNARLVYDVELVSINAVSAGSAACLAPADVSLESEYALARHMQ